jgi:putative Holliday junction resolvase
VQEKETANPPELTDLERLPVLGRILGLDPGTHRIGIAVCDELRVTTRAVDIITVSSWKKLLQNVKELIAELDAKALVIGLPLESDGGESEMSVHAREMARKFDLSLDIPVFLQDERVTSYDAKGRMWAEGKSPDDTHGQIDAEAAAIILADFLDRVRSMRR